MKLIYELGSVLAIDEMMIRFRVKSNETHRIKNKPIAEGYKFFVLATREGYIVNFTPDGRLAANDVYRMDYDSTNKNLGKIGSLVLYLCDAIILLKEQQMKRIENTLNRKITRRRGLSDKSIDCMSRSPDDFVIAMDNYFTRPKVIFELRKLNIGIVGTAQYQRGWPPEVLKKFMTKNVISMISFGLLMSTVRWLLDGWTMGWYFVHPQSIDQTSLLKDAEENREKQRKMRDTLIKFGANKEE